MRIIQNHNYSNNNNNNQVGSGTNNNTSTAVAGTNNNNGLPIRRPVCSAEVFALADGLRRSRAVEFSLPHSLAVSEVRLLYYLRSHGDFIRRQQQNNNNTNKVKQSDSSSSVNVNANAAQMISDVVFAIRDLCTNNTNNFSQSSSSSHCVLTEDEIIQLIDLKVQSEVDLYKIIPDIDSRLGGESKIASLLALLLQLK